MTRPSRDCRDGSVPDAVSETPAEALQGAATALNHAIYGAADGEPVIALHGTPGSRLKFASVAGAAARHGLQIVSVDRWGYGRTGVPKRPSFQAFADDVARLADRLDLESFALAGISGGAPFAAAAAARLGERVRRLALISPLGPVDGLARRDLTVAQAFCFHRLPALPGLTTAAMALFRLQLAWSPRAALALAMLASARADKALLADAATRAGLAATFAEGLAERRDGPVLDLGLFTAPWDFDLTSIRTPTRVWLGTDDRNVPLAAARRYAAEIPDATLHMLAGEGHFWIARRPDDVLAWLAGASAESSTSPAGSPRMPA